MLEKQLLWKNVVQPLAIVLGAWGGFPEPPQIFKQLIQNELIQYFLVFALVYQGGGSQDVGTGLMVAVGFYLLNKILNLRNLVGTLEQRGQAPAPAPPQIVVVKQAPPKQQQQPIAESFYM